MAEEPPGDEVQGQDGEGHGQADVLHTDGHSLPPTGGILKTKYAKFSSVHFLFV